MSYELSRRPVPHTRRDLLLSAIAAATAAAGVSFDPATATSMMKISQVAVAYQDHPDGDKQCSKCAQFLPPQSCKMVDGTISPQGYCRIFKSIHQAARRDRAALTG
jgi:hypothetical protein